MKRIQSILDTNYDKMEEFEKKISVTIDKIEALNQGVKSAENIKRMLDNFEKLYEKNVLYGTQADVSFVH